MEAEALKALAEVLKVAPWAAVIAIICWPQKGIIALFLRTRHEQRMKELERGATHKELVEAAKRRHDPPLLPPQQGALPPPSQENFDDLGDI